MRHADNIRRMRMHTNSVIPVPSHARNCASTKWEGNSEVGGIGCPLGYHVRFPIGGDIDQRAVGERSFAT